MKGIDIATLICFKKLPDDWGNPYYDSLVIVKDEEDYKVKYYHSETGLLNTGTTWKTLEKATEVLETILKLGS
jgi:hypothetical protein